MIMNKSKTATTITNQRSKFFGLVPFTAFFTIIILLAFVSSNIKPVFGSHQSINLDHLGNYHGIVIGFSNDFRSFETQYINTTIVSIMNQLQKTSNILKQLIGVQIADVTIILPDEWQIELNDLQKLKQFNVHESNHQYQSLLDADILFTNDDKNQILTMQYGDCGEGALPINFPILYVSDEYSGRLLAHQWLIYRYGVFNEFGLVDDFNYPVYFAPPDGGIRQNIKPEVNSCYQGNNPHFKYSNNCNNATDPNTGRPINPNCDVIPTKNTIHSSFMYAPIAVSEYRLCDSANHDYQSPTKHNIFCDYQSIQDVISKHTDFERFKPTFRHTPSNNSAPLIRFQILQNKNILNKDSSVKANVLYVLPKYNSKFLETSMDTIKKMAIHGFFPHQAMFALYEQKFEIVSGWRPSSLLSMIFLKDENVLMEKINLKQIFEDVSKQFQNLPGGTCVLFFSGDMQIDNTNIDYIELLADLFNKKSIRLKVIIFDQPPSNKILRFFDQLSSKMNMKSSVEYAFGHKDSSSSIMAFRTQLISFINTILFDLLQDLTEQTHMLIKRETDHSNNPAGIEFTLDPSIGQSNILIEMNTNGKGSDLALGFNLTDAFRNVINFITFESYDKSIVIHYNVDKPGNYRFNFRSDDKNTFITTSVRVLSKQSLFHSYKDAIVSARCWIQASKLHPLRGFVQVTQGLNGPIYDADVSFSARAFTKTQQKNEITRPLNDDGRGNPDITAHDGIYSAYLDSLFIGNSESYVAAYTIIAKISSHKMAMKPGNFGNTVMFNSKPRCCGSELKTNGDYVLNHQFERIVHCGSFYHSIQHEHVTTNYAIRDLRIVNIDSENRTISLEWSSPFYSMDQNKPIIIKAFHSYSEHSKLPLEIKESFDREQNEAELEVITNESTNNDEPSVMYETISSGIPYNSQASFDHDQSLKSSTNTITNSLRQVSIRILSPEEGFYLIAVKDRNDENESKPSNIVTVYLKSNVLIENTTALAIDNSRLSVGSYRENTRSRSLPWIHILIICIICALILFMIILIIICFTIRRYRRTGKKSESEFKSSTQKKHTGNGLIPEDKNEEKPYYMSQDANSLISHSLNDKMVPNSSVSNHTSCSSVNTVDNPHPYTSSHHHDSNSMEGSNRVVSMEQNGSNNGSQASNNNGIMKELNVATLLPNSWDAKELLDHWGRIQEAKLRQESPPIIHRIQSNSPSVLSYGGSSSLDNYNNHSYLCQPAIVQQRPPSTHNYQMQPHHPIANADYQPQSSTSIYSPYSNASSIWQQHQQKKQQQASYLPGRFDIAQQQLSAPSANQINYDDNGLPEYSVVRKILPNISQV